MKEAVNQEQRGFIQRRMPEQLSLAHRVGPGNSDIAQVPPGVAGWKRQHIGRMVLTQERAIQTAQLAIPGDPNRNLRRTRTRTRTRTHPPDPRQQPSPNLGDRASTGQHRANVSGRQRCPNRLENIHAKMES